MKEKVVLGLLIVAVLIVGAFVIQDMSSSRQDTSTTATEETTSSPAPQTNAKVKIEDEVVGTGQEAKSGDTVVVNYTGTLEDGTKFDSSYDSGKPFETQIGVGKVIQGWDQGIPGMKVGGKRKLTIPPELGYGSANMGSIPPNSTLIFEVELLEVK